MNGYFVTGTDTGVGKTHVTCLLARRARARRMTVFAFKPIETGCALGELGADQQQLVEAAGDWQTGRLRGLYCFSQPAAPRVAAEAEATVIDLARVIDAVHEGSAVAGLTMVEGAGGWRVPITETEDMSALARRLSLPILVVARASLGTINHSLLTIEAIARDGCSIEALILSQRPDDDPGFTRSNASEIASRWPGRIVVCEGDGAALEPLF